MSRLELTLALQALVASAVWASATEPPPSYQPWNHSSPHEPRCLETEVVILGAGVTGITAGSALTNHSIHDFLIVEYQGEIGGRAHHTNFGYKPDGSPYVIELGANWVQGLVSPPGPENPIWTLAKKFDLNNTYSNYTSILTYDSTGYNDFTDVLNDFEDNTFDALAADAGYLITESLLDQSTRAGLYEVGWFPENDPIKDAVEWWEWDWETAYSPDQSSELFGIAGYNLTFNQFSDANNFVIDQRGFSWFIKGLADEYLKPNDPRLMLNTTVMNVNYTASDSVMITLQPTVNTTGSVLHNNASHWGHHGHPTCIRAKHAITTFSLGVLQHSLSLGSSSTSQTAKSSSNPLSFTPALPSWKQSSILGFDMGIYTKIFLQFNTTATPQFWDPDTQYFLYADPVTRGYYPLWQSLSTPGFFEDSGILFVTVVGPQSKQVERQTEEQTLKQVMEVLRTMFPNETIPDPIAFTYPRWGKTEWAYGSYSNWPTGVTLEEHQNLRANVGPVWFAGEHTSAEYFGFLHGGYFEGQAVGKSVAACLNNGSNSCPGDVHYEVLNANGGQGSFNAVNGWFGGVGASFVTYGLQDSDENGAASG